MKARNDYTQLNAFERFLNWVIDNAWGISFIGLAVILVLLIGWLFTAIAEQTSPEAVMKRCLAYEVFTEQECETIQQWERINE